MKDPLSLSALISAFGNDLAGVGDRESLLRVVARHFNEQLTFSDILLSIVNEDKQTHSVTLYHTDPSRQEKSEYASLSHEKFRIEDGVCNITMASPSPLVVDIASILLRPAPPRYIARWYRPAISRMIAVRLRSHNQLLGALFFFFEKAHIGIDDLGVVQHFSYMIAPALKNILTEERTSRQQQDNETLLSLSTDFVKVRDKEDLFRQLNIRLRQLFVFDHSCIALVDKEKKIFRASFLHQPAAGPFDDDYVRKANEGIPYDGGLVEATLATDQPLIFDLDEYMSPEAPEFIRHSHDRGIKEVVMMALRKEGESFGFLILFSTSKGWFTSRHLDIIRPLSHQLSIAFTNILAHEAILESAHDKTLILSLGKDLASTRNKKDFPTVIQRTLRPILPYDELTISRLNPDNETHSVYLDDLSAASKSHPDYITRVARKYPVQDGVYEVLLQSGAPLVYDMDQLIRNEVVPPYVTFFHGIGMREMLAIPLKENDKGIGGVFVYLKEKGKLSHLSFSLLQGLSAQISIGLTNIRAYEEIESQLEEIHHYKSRLEEENYYLQEQVRTAHGFTEMVGAGSAMQKLFQLVSIVSPSDSTVLIVGEAGTGKELVAKAIHNASLRKGKCMIKVNCADLPANLVESELFGHEKGSFPGAVERRIGKFELANGSTLFLDEMGEMPLELQGKLLRAMQEGEIERMGGESVIKTNVRIIAATNRDLRKEVEAGKFRSDLFHRLNVFPIHLPPLRDRKEDLPMLASHFISQQAQRSGKKITNISRRVLENLMRYDWPGNVRELGQLIERSVLMTTGSTIREIPLPTDLHTGPSDPAHGNSLKTLDELERDHILAVLKKCGHKIGGPGGAAELLRLPATTLHSKIKKLGIKKKLE
ncbi:sigma 54-interacting transcriptional regulator [Flavitalea sp. BT771]|uniref:sigma 54-interacting transcriptional regulator n=1 Tax=Flavitalea sp. BT771 TaxID=3063329 RepID=UPI0026E22928|nr:sigma 54-interacting transcriptional regulator [Flavitalea sp. BT771]MDO6431731.1 sigma 54-interacting transcriptional regulator [Flavitalea sp. BT771]MDV6220639.1 sigma 54-interacting transcriptional regulator [Flavitalea sp. BT771]